MTRIWGPDQGDDDAGSIYRAVRDEQLHDDVPEQEDPGTATTMLPATGQHELRSDDTEETPVLEPEASPALSAGEQDHADPWAWAGEDADPPQNPDGVPRGATPWRNCAASLALVAEVNQRWPGRDKASDGTIGDAAHATRTSDHNPWVIVAGVGVVRARDIDKDGIDAAWVAEYLRILGARRDPRLYPGGYVIFNRRITTPDFSGWKTYTGSNPHTEHVHVSFSTAQAGFDSKAAWGLIGAVPDPGAAKLPTLTYGMRGNPSVARLQKFLNAYGWRPALSLLEPAGNYLDQTKDVVRRAQAQMGITGSDADGSIVGPRTNQALWSRGYRG